MSRLTVVRSSHAGGFTQVLNSALRPESRLSAQALGVLVHLLSHSDGWDVSVASLTRQFKNSHTSMKATVRELKEAGYIEARKFNTAIGMRHEWIVHEEPIGGTSTGGLPTDGQAADIKNTIDQNTHNEVDWGSRRIESNGSGFDSSVARLRQLLNDISFDDLDAEGVWHWIREKENARYPDAWAAALDAKGELAGYLRGQVFDEIEMLRADHRWAVAQ